MALSLAKRQQRCLFFRLPLELRQQIYDLLIPKEILLNSIQDVPVGFESVDHRKPDLEMISKLESIHPTVAKEIVDYYYDISTFKIVCNYSLQTLLSDCALDELEQRWFILKPITKVELAFRFDVRLNWHSVTDSPQLIEGRLNVSGYSQASSTMMRS